MNFSDIHTHYEHLKKHQTLSLPLDPLPAGEYEYRFSVINPNGFPYCLELRHSGLRAKSEQLSHSEKLVNYRLEWTQPAALPEASGLELRLLDGPSLLVRPSVSPRMMVRLEGSEPSSPSPVDQINYFFNSDPKERERHREDLKPGELFQQLFSEVRAQNATIRQQNLSNPPAIFYEFIDLKSAEKQMDYVVKSKMLRGRSGNIFKKSGRALLRIPLQLGYYLLTSNSKAKRYMAKLYRNYINLNYLSERTR